MSLHFQCFALLPQALTQSPQQGRPAADHMARLPDQVMTWSHNMYSLSPSSLRQCPPRFTRHVLQRFSHTIVNWTTASTAPRWEAPTDPGMEGFQLFFRRKLIFSVLKGGSVNWFDTHLVDIFNASSACAGSLCIRYHNDHHTTQASQWQQTGFSSN